MTAKDITLIKEAEKYSYMDWHKVMDLIKLADTDEARRRLDNIATHLYHTEEYYAGLL